MQKFNGAYLDRVNQKHISSSPTTKTKQSFKDEVDVNNIIRRFQKTGELPAASRVPRYEDFSNVPSYQDALNFVAGVNDAFLELPSRIRNQFSNDPGAYLDFVSDPKNADALVE